MSHVQFLLAIADLARPRVLGRATQFLLFVAVGALLTGCATIISGTTQDIEFSSVPTGANVKLNDGAQTVTPGKLTLKRKENYTALFTKDGYPERQAEVKRDRMGNWWVLGNILFGGLIGIVIDIVSGAQHHLVPEHLIMDMSTGVVLEKLPTELEPPKTSRTD